jgi:methyl-accepting chemotaxis protein
MPDTNLLERSFKLKFGLKLCLLTIAGMAAVTLLLYFYTAGNLGGSYKEAIYTIYDLKIRIFPLVFASSYSIFILAVVTASIAVITVLFSHKIAGPLFRVERNLEEIGSGDLTVQTRFRGNDQMKALSDDINGMTRSLNHAARSLADSYSLVEEREKDLTKLLETEPLDKGRLSEAADRLALAIEQFNRTASAIKTKE